MLLLRCFFLSISIWVRNLIFNFLDNFFNFLKFNPLLNLTFNLNFLIGLLFLSWFRFVLSNSFFLGFCDSLFPGSDLLLNFLFNFFPWWHFDIFNNLNYINCEKLLFHIIKLRKQFLLNKCNYLKISQLKI